MSIALATKEIVRFLTSQDAEVLCLRGRWGVGKTFTWNKLVKESKKQIRLTKYSYVSLFGLNSLDALKYSTFENSVRVQDADVEPDLQSFETNTAAMLKQLGRRSLSFLKGVPTVGDYVRGLDALAFLSVRDAIICIDDIERKSNDLPVRDIFGLIAQLKERRKCKVVLILNDDALVDSEKADFDRYSEKVIDITINFAPTTRECADIALSATDDVHNLIRDNCVALGISNIRLINRMKRLAAIVTPTLRNFEKQVMAQAILSIVLFVWSLYGEEAPKTDFLLKQRTSDAFGLRKPEEISDDEKKWNALLNEAGFGMADEFDLILLEGIRRGYFDEVALKKMAAKLDETIRESKKADSFSNAWALYHDTLDNNEGELVGAIYRSFKQGVQQITPINLNGTIRLLKDLGHATEAAELLAFYMAERKDGRGFFDLDHYGFSGDVTEPEVKAAFKAKYLSFKDERNPSDVLVKISKNKAWGDDDIALLSKLSADNFYEIFKKAKGTDLGRMINVSLMFGQMAGLDAETKAISGRASEALKKIGGESKLNARRLARYGIQS